MARASSREEPDRRAAGAQLRRLDSVNVPRLSVADLIWLGKVAERIFQEEFPQISPFRKAAI
jgi:hypothetical protein